MADQRDADPARGPRAEEVIAAYVQAVAAGRPPDRRELLARYAGLAK